MAFSENGNPFLTESSFSSAGDGMSRGGVMAWLIGLIGILVLSGGFVWNEAFKSYGDFDFTTIRSVPTGEKDSKGKEISKRLVVDPQTGEQSPIPEFDLGKVKFLMLTGCFGGLFIGLIIIFNQRTAPILAPVYAAFEGLALGGVSAAYEIQFQGIAMQAALLTVMVMIAMLLLFAFGVLRATGGFVTGVLACMFGVIGVYLVDLGLQAFGGSPGLSIVHSNGWMGIGFSIFVCILAGLNFVIDFDTIEKGVERGAPRYMNAYCAFGVLLTLVWLYLEILRLLAKLKSQDSK
jgi:uncharacterized YccA/Bax inhibitor family protein